MKTMFRQYVAALLGVVLIITLFPVTAMGATLNSALLPIRVGFAPSTSTVTA